MYRSKKTPNIGEKLPQVHNWENQIDIHEVNVDEIAKETKFSRERIAEALKITDRNIFHGRSLEKDILRRYKKRLDHANSLNDVLALLRGYRNSIESARGSLAPYNTGKVPDRNIENIFIWHLAHRYKLSPKSAK